MDKDEPWPPAPTNPPQSGVPEQTRPLGPRLAPFLALSGGLGPLLSDFLHVGAYVKLAILGLYTLALLAALLAVRRHDRARE